MGPFPARCFDRGGSAFGRKLTPQNGQKSEKTEIGGNEITSRIWAEGRLGRRQRTDICKIHCLALVSAKNRKKNSLNRGIAGAYGNAPAGDPVVAPWSGSSFRAVSRSQIIELIWLRAPHTVLTGSQWILMWTSRGCISGLETYIDFHLLVRLGDGPKLL